MTVMPEQPILEDYSDLFNNAASFAVACRERDERWAVMCSSNTYLSRSFDRDYSLRSAKGQELFRATLLPILTAEGEEKENIIALFPTFLSVTPYPIRLIGNALAHPDCPPDLVSLGARHSWYWFRRYAVGNPACTDEDRVYAALMGQR